MKKYTEKEMTIFGGVLKLAQEGTDLSKITARQIAEAAGMGKATIYDYFSSKEEIIVKALVYALDSQNSEIRLRLACLPDFRSRMHLVFNEIIDNVENSSSIFNIISNSTTNFAAVVSAEQCSMLEEITEEIKKTFRDILKEADENGEIALNDMSYAGMALTGAIFATGKYRTEKILPREEICKNAYTMLIRALK